MKKNGTTNNRKRDYLRNPGWGYAGPQRDTNDLIQKLGIFAPDPAAGEEFYQGRNAIRCGAWGERLLRLAMVQDAIACYLMPKRPREEQGAYERRKREAGRWLTRPDSGDTFSFAFICEEILRIDPARAWRAIRRMAHSVDKRDPILGRRDDSFIGRAELE